MATGYSIFVSDLLVEQHTLLKTNNYPEKAILKMCFFSPKVVYVDMLVPGRVTTVGLKSSTQKAVENNDEMLIGLKIDVHEDAGPWEICWTQLGR